MKKFEITFDHTIKETYTAIVEAENEDEAKEIFDSDPFEYAEKYPIDSSGIDMEITDIKEKDQ
jgi:hypothetical protein